MRNKKCEKGKWFEMESIVDCRGQKKRREYRVRWTGFGPLGDTWELERHLMADGAEHCIQRYHAMQALMYVLVANLKKEEKAFGVCMLES